MSDEIDPLEALKSKIVEDPGVILEDRAVMQALLAADPGSDGRNVVDLRGRLVQRLEERLDRLEDTHRTVIAAAYENLAGTNQIHRAVLSILEPMEFTEFLKILAHDVANILSVDVIRLGFETTSAAPGTPLGPSGELADLIIALPQGGVDLYATQNAEVAARKVTLRQCKVEADGIYGEDKTWVRSEALLKLDLGKGKLPGVLAFGAEDPHRFHPDQGVDLLNFFTGAFERVLRRWLA